MGAPVFADSWSCLQLTVIRPVFRLQLPAANAYFLLNQHLKQIGMSSPGTDHFGSLMAAALEGDKRAYAALLTELMPVLRRFVGTKMRGSDIEDVVQEVLMSVHAARHTFEPGRPLLPWLFAIASRRIADHFRQQRRAARLSPDDYALLKGDAASAAQVDDEIAVAEVFRRWLPRLPASQRLAVDLLKLRGMSLDIAAQYSGLSVPALKVALHRALRGLKDDLAQANV